MNAKSLREASKLQIKAIVFDLDGTLLDTLQDIASSANATLAESGYPQHESEIYRRYLGDGLANLARKILPLSRRDSRDVEMFVARYRDIYASEWDKSSRPFPGVEELLRELKRNSFRLAVLSNKRDDFTHLCVEKLLPKKSFEIVRGEIAGVPLKPDPTSALGIARQLGLPPEQCMYVGDSEIDVDTAINSGMFGVGVTWGFRDADALLDADLVIDSPDQLLEFLSLT